MEDKLGAMEANKPVITENSSNYLIARESLDKLKDSTKKMLKMIEDIERKIVTKNAVKNAFTGDTTVLPVVNLNCKIDLAADLPESIPLLQLEQQINELKEIQVEDDDCSVFKRLMRKCHCLNRAEYNDLVIHFNEDTKFSTSRVGEMIKNMNILKRFLYIGGEYTRNALMFLNEGLTKCPLIEKVDILVACSHADLCNVFNGDSIVHVCLAWPIKYVSSGDKVTQNLTARVLYRMASVQEGKRYLNFNSKTLIALQKLLKTDNKHLDEDTKEFIQATIKLLSPTVSITSNIASCYHKADEDAADHIISTLYNFREFLTLEEVRYNLDMLNKLSQTSFGKQQMWRQISTTYSLFKELLLQYDDSTINMSILNIITKLLSKSELPSVSSKAFVVSDTSTEPPEVKHEGIQIPQRPKNYKGMNRNSIRSQSQFRNLNNKDKEKSKLSVFNKSLTLPRKTRTFSKLMQRGKSNGIKNTAVG